MGGSTNPPSTDGSAELTTLFCLPFVFRPKAQTRVAPRTELRRIQSELIAALESDRGPVGAASRCQWQRASADEYRTGLAHYDERRYLHPFARDVLTAQTFLTLKRAPWSSEDLGSGVPLELTLSDGKSLTGLSLVSCQLHLFDAGVGVLSLEIDGQGKPQELLKFNETFRRIGRSYLKQPDLPRTVTIAGAAYPLFTTEGEWTDDTKCPPDDPATLLTEQALIKLLIGDRLGPAATVNRDWTVEPVLDERMVVITWMGHRCLGNVALDSLWQQLLFVDSSPNGSYNAPADDPFTQALRGSAEYRRWWNSQRIGFTRYSAAFMGRADGPFAEDIRNQVRRVYYTLGLMMLLHRAKLLEFSRLSSTLSKAIAAERPPRNVHDNVRRLRESFLDFATRYWFIELTNQDQGIDMTEKWSEALRNRQLFNEVQEEIERFEALQTQRAADRTNFTLQWLSIALGFVALWTGALGANVAWPELAQSTATDTKGLLTVAAASVILVLSAAVVGALAYGLNHMANRRHR
jgi:hypothetical protein